MRRHQGDCATMVFGVGLWLVCGSCLEESTIAWRLSFERCFRLTGQHHDPKDHLCAHDTPSVRGYFILWVI